MSEPKWEYIQHAAISVFCGMLSGFKRPHSYTIF